MTLAKRGVVALVGYANRRVTNKGCSVSRVLIVLVAIYTVLWIFL